ncbi:MAG TPA: class III extradiol ring-cleavage dioxygenase [Pyrinomonadaceae bacterium]|jgi:4,5-DOPA dioxygenase extradiol
MSDALRPSLFVSHGAPTLAVERNDTTEFLRRLGADLGTPRAVLCVSAHWTTSAPAVSAAARPETIHDFGGFAPGLFNIQYPAPGAPWLAARVAELLAQASLPAHVAPARGLDHGAWVPLLHLFPAARVPVAQLSVQPHADPAAHFRLGQALAPLRREDVLVLATGSATHNLARLAPEGDTPPWAAEFDDWLNDKITHGALDDLLDYRRRAPHAALAHPTEEHLLPLFVAAGAGAHATHARGRTLHRGWTYGSLSMAAYSFGDEEVSKG